MQGSTDESVFINDCTLRDGEQAPGVAFSPDEKLRIALALERAGVDEIEVGIPAMGPDEVKVLRDVSSALSRSVGSAWCRMKERDVDAALETGLPHLHLSAPVSDRQIAVKRAGSRKRVLETVERVVEHAFRSGRTVSVGGEDASRADMDFVVELAGIAQQAGASKFRYADTVGVLDPFRTREVFEQLRAALPNMGLEFHGHDDLGLATANTLAAVRGGASHASVCVLGLGERAGNAALEEVVTGLALIETRETRVSPSALAQLAELIAFASQREIPSAKAIVGSSVFAHESGIHVSGLLRDPEAYEGVRPERFGKQRQIVVGKHSGRAAIRHVLRSLGVSADEQRLRLVLEQVRALAAARKGVVLDEDLLALYAGAETEAVQAAS